MDIPLLLPVPSYLSIQQLVDIWMFSHFLNYTTLNIRVQDFVWIYVSISLRHIPKDEIPESYGNSMFNSEKLMDVFILPQPYHCTFLPTVYVGPDFSVSLSKIFVTYL